MNNKNAVFLLFRNHNYTTTQKYFQVHILTFIKIRSNCHTVLKAAFSVKYFSNLFYLNPRLEIDFQEVQEAQRVPKKLDQKRNTTRHIIIKLPKIKDKERILKAAREKERVTYKGVPIRLSADFSKENLQA